ncbi:MAG: hypothetical protein KDD70_06115 [Bdellovibrionales bacterium]|nr:hypothetical protein [Bdellovibrionales bacterium]
MSLLSSRVSLKTVFFFLFATVGLFVFVGCAPRGETKTLDEVFQIAKQRYERGITESKASSETRERLLKIVSSFDEFVNAESEAQVKNASQLISDEMQALIMNAGYTTRPALGEIVKSYRGLAYPEERESPVSTGGDGTSSEPAPYELNESAKKLLVARSYTALAQELETTSFQVGAAG